MKPIIYFVDDEPQRANKPELTPREILTHVGKEPCHYYLKQLVCGEDISYKDRLDCPIKMAQGMKFISIFCGATVVS